MIAELEAHLHFEGRVRVSDRGVGYLQCRKYIDQEIRGPSNQLPPLEDGLALNIIRRETRRYGYASCSCRALQHGPKCMAQRPFVTRS